MGSVTGCGREEQRMEDREQEVVGGKYGSEGILWVVIELP